MGLRNVLADPEEEADHDERRLEDKTDAESCKGSEASAKSVLGSDASSLEEKPVKSDKDLTIYEILERRAATQTVIDILKDEEDFKMMSREEESEGVESDIRTE